MHVVESRADARKLEQWARDFEAEGVGVEFSAKDPYEAGFAASMRVENDFVTQPARLTEAIASSCGATLYDHNEIYGIQADRHRLAVHGRRARIRCRRVFIATNGYTANLHPYLARIVRPVRGQILLAKPLPPRLKVAGSTEFHYFRQLPEGSVMIGGARSFFMDQEDTSEDLLTPNIHASLESHLRRWFGLEEFEVERRWAGIHGFTPDRRAAIGLIPDEPRIAFALGFSGYGNSIGLVSAQRMVELALDQRDAGPLSSTRFD